MSDTNSNADEIFDLAVLIPAMEALTKIEPILGGSVAAKLELADRLRDGRLIGYSRVAWNSTKRNVLEAWREEPDENDSDVDVEYDIDVSASVWRRSVQWPEDQATWRWPSGRFSVVHKIKTRLVRIMLDQMHFERAAVEDLRAYLAGESGPPTLAAPTKSEDTDGFDPDDKPIKSDRNTRGKAHGLVLLEIVRLWQTGALAGPGFSTQAKALEHLTGFILSKSRPDIKPLSATTLEPMIRVVLPALRDGMPCKLLDGHRFARPHQPARAPGT